MTRFRRWCVLAVLLMLTVVSASVQAGGSFFTVLYAEQATGTGTQGFFYVLDESTITQIIPVPASVYPSGSYQINDIKISPDLRWAAFSMIHADTYLAYPVVVADLTLQTCCQFLEMGMAELQANELGGFDPSSRYLVYSRIAHTLDATFTQVGEIVMLDTESGMFSVTQSPDLLGEQGTWALVGDWWEDGIRIHPNCYGCEGVIEGEWWIWNPLTGSLIEHSGEPFSGFGATLLPTRESVVMNEVSTFPMNTEPSMFGRPNVIQYYTGLIPSFGEDSARDAAPVVFFDPANIDLTDGEYVAWITDGTAFLVTDPNSSSWTTVARGGFTSTVNVAPGTRLLTGTPHGFFTVQETGGAPIVSSYVLQNGFYTQQVIAQVGANVRLVYSPPLGFNLPLPPPQFATIAPQAAAPTIAPVIGSSFVCASVNVAPRLGMNGNGRVTPGSPNNLRNSPSRSGALLGQIPGGGMFLVLSDPICAEGFIWRQVNYNGIIGYTVEATGNEYFLEPAG